MVCGRSELCVSAMGHSPSFWGCAAEWRMIEKTPASRIVLCAIFSGFPFFHRTTRRTVLSSWDDPCPSADSLEGLWWRCPFFPVLPSGQSLVGDPRSVGGGEAGRVQGLGGGLESWGLME